ncbi:MAG: hypothetical protein EAZ92_12020 [Candidatus Kapaibacterium sp.]|nr:MAG: hypothetical protein EAZ92_12020 [Candidatus Kapabacteria bacterium]
MMLLFENDNGSERFSNERGTQIEDDCIDEDDGANVHITLIFFSSFIIFIHSIIFICVPKNHDLTSKRES